MVTTSRIAVFSRFTLPTTDHACAIGTLRAADRIGGSEKGRCRRGSGSGSEEQQFHDGNRDRR